MNFNEKIYILLLKKREKFGLISFTNYETQIEFSVLCFGQSEPN